MNEELMKKMDEIQKDVHSFKAKNDENEKKRDGLNEEALDKMQKSILDSVEKLDEKQVAAEKRLEAIEVYANRAEKAGVDKEKINENKSKFNEFLRKKSDNPRSLELMDSEGLLCLKEMSVGVDPDGGYSVRPEYADEIIGRIFETSAIRKLANSMTIGSDSIILSIDDDEVGSGWVGEQETRSETDTAQIGEVEIFVHELYAMPIATQKLLDDSMFDVEAFLSQKVAQKFGREENTAFVTGNGIKKPKGLLDYDAWAVDGTYERNKLEQIEMGNASLLTADGFIDVQNSLLEDYQANANWLMNRSTYGAAMKLKDGQGQYLFDMGLSNAGKPEILLRTKPVTFAADMPVVATNALSVLYGDFRLGYTVVDRRGITLLRDPYTTKGKVKFYNTKRTGAAVTNFQSLKIGKIAA